MPRELRAQYHRELDRLDISVAAVLGVIPDAVVRSTTALLEADAELTRSMRGWRTMIDGIYADIDSTVEVTVARQAPVGADLRLLLACVRIVPVLHAAVDEIAEIASPVTERLAERATPRISRLLEELGAATAATWRAVDQAWTARGDGVDVVRDLDDGRADTRSALVAEIASGAVDVPVAMELAVVARSYDRLGHHAQVASRLILPLVPVP